MESEEAATERARTLFREGLALLQEGRPDLAATRLRQAFDIAQRPGILINLAAALARAGKPVRAARAYTRYLTRQGEGVTRRARRAARRGLRSLRRDIARVHFSLPSEEHAYVQLNGEPVEAWMADVDYPVAPGAQELSYAVDGEVRGVARATVRRGQRAVLRFEAPE